MKHVINNDPFITTMTNERFTDSFCKIHTGGATTVILRITRELSSCDVNYFALGNTKKYCGLK